MNTFLKGFFVLSENFVLGTGRERWKSWLQLVPQTLWPLWWSQWVEHGLSLSGGPP